MDNNNSNNDDSNNNNNKLYGWYSQQMRDRINENNRYRLPEDQRNPAHIYQTIEGKEVIVTTVSKANNLTDLCRDGLFINYTDMYYIGEVTTYVRSLKE